MLSSDFDVFCCSGDKYDYSILETNNIIDCLITDLKANVPYVIVEFKENVHKYDIDTDNINLVTIITLETKDDCSRFRITAPAVLMEHLEMIADKLSPNCRLTIIRKEHVINCFIN